MTRRWEAGPGAKLRTAADRLLAPVQPALAVLGRGAKALFTCGGHCGPQPAAAAGAGREGGEEDGEGLPVKGSAVGLTESGAAGGRV